MDAITAIAQRKSIRSYQPEQVAEEDLAKMVLAGQQAPIAGAVHFTVIQDRALLEELSEEGRQAMLRDNDFFRGRASIPGYTPLYHAPTLILISAPASGNFGEVNAALASENIMIAATALGYGTCYLAGIGLVLREDKAWCARAGIPPKYAFCCGVIVGRTDDPELFGPPKTAPGRKYNNVTYIK